MGTEILEPMLEDSSTGTGRWMVVIFDNDHNSMDEVIEVLMEATGCGVDEAYIEMWEAHTFGKAPVHFASREECDQAASIIARVGIQTEVCLEWQE